MPIHKFVIQGAARKTFCKRFRMSGGGGGGDDDDKDQLGQQLRNVCVCVCVIVLLSF